MDLPIENCDFPWLCGCLPEGILMDTGLGCPIFHLLAGLRPYASEKLPVDIVNAYLAGCAERMQPQNG